MKSLRSSQPVIKLIAITVLVIISLAFIMPGRVQALPTEQRTYVGFSVAKSTSATLAQTFQDVVADASEKATAEQKDHVIPLRGATKSQATVAIPDQKTPLDPMQRTEVWSLFDMISVIAMAGLTIVMIITYPRRKTSMSLPLFAEDEQTAPRRRHLLRLATIPLTVVSIAIFAANESPTYTMTWVGALTPYFLVAAVLVVLLFLVCMSMSIYDERANSLAFDYHNSS